MPRIVTEAELEAWEAHIAGGNTVESGEANLWHTVREMAAALRHELRKEVGETHFKCSACARSVFILAAHKGASDE